MEVDFSGLTTLKLCIYIVLYNPIVTISIEDCYAIFQINIINIDIFLISVHI